MAVIVGVPTVELKVTIELTEAEAWALDALSCYGDDAFINTFYEYLGESYLGPHEKGLRSLFTAVRGSLPIFLTRVCEARDAFNEAKATEKSKI